MYILTCVLCLLFIVQAVAKGESVAGKNEVEELTAVEVCVPPVVY
jgi:hypothetical protein